MTAKIDYFIKKIWINKRSDIIEQLKRKSKYIGKIK